MSTESTQHLERSAASHRWPARLLPAVVAAVLGAVLVYAAGFAAIDSIHNAAHDVRHSAAMPCH